MYDQSFFPDWKTHAYLGVALVSTLTVYYNNTTNKLSYSHLPNP
jgi:hypothetical protein